MIVGGLRACRVAWADRTYGGFIPPLRWEPGEIAVGDGPVFVRTRLELVR